MEISDSIRILQASITPSVLISGFGLLLLTMTNRLSRPIDRIRLLTGEIKRAPDEEASSLQQQILILNKRCHLLQSAIALVTISIFFASIIILMLFAMLILDLNLESVIQLLFAASLISLIASLLFFLMDIRMTLKSITIEVNKYVK